MSRYAVHDAAVIFPIALVALVFYQRAWPPAPGRDFATYVQYYVDMWSPSPTYPTLMLYRTPIAPLFIGLVTEFGGAAAMAWALRLGYAVTVCATYAIAARWNRQTGWLAAVALLVYPGFAAFFHEVAGDVVFCVAFTSWAAAACWTADPPTPKRYVAHAIAVSILVLIRPVAQICLAFAIVPFVTRGVSQRTRIASAVAFLATSAVLLGGWAEYNRLRYGELAIARGGLGITPFYRVFAVDKIVREDNGPASRALADAMRTDLLDHEPYASRGLDVATVFAAGNDRMWSDVFALSDRVWGWHSDHAMLGRVAYEAIRRQPLIYVGHVMHDAVATLGLNEYAPDAPTNVRPAPASPSSVAKPQLIPYSYVWWLASTPDGHRAPLEPIVAGPRLVAITTALSLTDGSANLAKTLNGLGRMYPPMIVFLAAGCIGSLFASGEIRVMAVLLSLGVLVVLASAAGQGIVYQYRLPFDPLFIAFWLHGFVRDGLCSAVGTRSCHTI